MPFKVILGYLVIAAILIGPLAWMVYFLRNPYRAMHTSKPTAAVGNALQELDRITRPSIQHAAEAEDEAQRPEDDDIGGE
ncbi:MAG: hypothetical protein DWQ37_13960 [Planctomycetota bacterium]|nr:MAG: hypothetical protein DWQ37_13960 [Planctomycetota bacterium]